MVTIIFTIIKNFIINNIIYKFKVLYRDLNETYDSIDKTIEYNYKTINFNRCIYTLNNLEKYNKKIINYFNKMNIDKNNFLNIKNINKFINILFNFLDLININNSEKLFSEIEKNEILTNSYDIEDLINEIKIDYKRNLTFYNKYYFNVDISSHNNHILDKNDKQNILNKIKHFDYVKHLENINKNFDNIITYLISITGYISENNDIEFFYIERFLKIIDYIKTIKIDYNNFIIENIKTINEYCK